MSYFAIACSIKSIEKHPNADRLQRCKVLGGFEVITGLDTKVGDAGIYFPIGGQLSEDFARANNLIEEYDEFGKKIPNSGYLNSNRRIQALVLRGVRSEGLWLPLDCLNYLERKVPFEVIKKFAQDSIVDGYEFDHIGEVEICTKYIPKIRKTPSQSIGPKKPKHRNGDYKNYSHFHKHRDTAILLKVIDSIPEGVELCVTAKLHGTSAVTGYVLADVELNWAQRAINKIYNLIGKSSKYSNKEYRHLVGSRNVVFEDKEDSFYRDPFRRIAADTFKTQLNKGEVVYYEIVGYTTNGKPLMKSHGLTKDIKKSFKGTERFPEEMVYTYGCEFGNFDIYVYRITNVDNDGNMKDLSWDDVKKRCAELNIKHVPELDRFIYDGNKDNLLMRLDPFLSDTELRPSVICNSHIEEGVCIRVLNNDLVPNIYKKHSFIFKVMEGKIEVPDAEDWTAEEQDAADVPVNGWDKETLKAMS